MMNRATFDYAIETALNEGIAVGKAEGKAEIVRQMLLSTDLSEETIALYSLTSIEFVQVIKKQLPTPN